MTHTALPPVWLEAASSVPERCDRCGAAAKIRFTVPPGGDLALCGHHANQHAERIAEVASLVIVEEGFDWRGVEEVTEGEAAEATGA